MEFFGWLLGALLLYAVVKGVMDANRPDLYCKACGKVGHPVKRTPGSLAIEIILWLCFIVPGLIYSLWRMTNKKLHCSSCNSLDLVPTDSPIALQPRNALQPSSEAAHAVSAATHTKCPDCAEIVLREARKCRHCGSALVQSA